MLNRPAAQLSCLQATSGGCWGKVSQYRLLADIAAQQPRLAVGLASCGVLTLMLEDAQTLAADRAADGLLLVRLPGLALGRLECQG